MSTCDKSGDCLWAEQIEAYLSGHDDKNLISHVETCDSCKTRIEEFQQNNALLERMRSSDLDPSSGPHSTGAIRSIAADEIPGYRMIDEIGRGGQGVVYRAEELATRRIVALKVLLAGTFATSVQRQRFEREVELAAALDHPGIVGIFHSGRTEAGRLYFAMQFIEGRRIDDLLDHPDQAAGEIDAIQLMIAICDAVSYAHQHGVIHRDLKPSNIIVSDDGKPHILDFGLARAIDRDTTRADSLTLQGQFAGSLVYASPEQTRGDPHLIDVRSDVYAIGVLLYQVFAGRLPYGIDDDLQSLLRSINDIMPPPPTAPLDGRSLYRGKLDHDLQTITLKALAKDPGRRYQSAAELRDDLQRYLDGHAINARRDSTMYVLRKTLSRHRWPVLASAAFLVLLIGSVIALSILYQRAVTEADKSRQIRFFLEDTLSSVEPGPDGGDMRLSQLLDEAVPWIDLALGDRPEIAAALHTIIGNSYRALGRFDRAESQLERGLQIRDELFPSDHPEIAQSLSGYGLLRRDQGRFDEAAEFFERALRIRDDHFGTEHPEVAITLANLALVRLQQGSLDEAERLLEESLTIRRRLFGENHSDVAMCYYNLASVSAARGDIGQALDHHRHALAIRERVLPSAHPDLNLSRNAIAALEVEAGRPDPGREQ